MSIVSFELWSILVAALLPPFMNVDMQIGPQYAVLLATNLAVSFAVLSGYAWATRRLSGWLENYGMQFNAVTGALFLGFALYLAYRVPWQSLLPAEAA